MASPKSVSSVKPLLNSFLGVCSAFCVTPSLLHTCSAFLIFCVRQGRPHPRMFPWKRKAGSYLCHPDLAGLALEIVLKSAPVPSPCARLHRRHFSLDRSDSILIGFHASSPSPFQSIFHAAVSLSKTHSDLVPPLLANPSPVGQSPISLVWRWPEPSPASSLDSCPSSHFSLLSVCSQCQGTLPLVPLCPLPHAVLSA